MIFLRCLRHSEAFRAKKLGVSPPRAGYVGQRIERHITICLFKARKKENIVWNFSKLLVVKNLISFLFLKFGHVANLVTRQSRHFCYHAQIKVRSQFIDVTGTIHIEVELK